MKISDDFSLDKDKYQWILTHHKPSTGKQGQPIVSDSVSYHATLEQVANKMVTLKCTYIDATTIQIFLREFKDSVDKLTYQLTSISKGE